MSKTTAILFSLILFLSFSLSFLSAAEDGIIFQYTGKIEMTGEGDYKALPISREIYAAGNPGLTDLRILDKEGGQVPYVLYSTNADAWAWSASTSMAFIERFMKDGDFYYDFAAEPIQFENTPDMSDCLGNGLIIESTSRNFAKEIRLYGSYDGLAWNYLMDSLIYQVEDHSQMAVDLGEALKYSWYRIQTPGTDAIDFTAIELVYEIEKEEKRGFTDTFSPDFTVEEKDRTTVITIPHEEIRNLNIQSAAFDIPDNFQRPFELAGMRHTLYHLAFQDKSLKQTAIQDMNKTYNGAQNQDMVITIHNGDDRPLEIQSITLTYAYERLVFKDEGEAYTLAVGNPDLTVPPVYDINRYYQHILEEADLLAAPLLIKNDNMPAPKAAGSNDALFLNIAAVCASAVLIVVILSTAKKSGQKH